MSLPVGTLVLIVRGRCVGRTGTITQPLRKLPLGLCYVVDIPGTEHIGDPGVTGDEWLVSPASLIPLTPPGTPDDVTTDEPREVAA